MWSGLSMDRFPLVNGMVSGHAKDGAGAGLGARQHAGELRG
jgi:hypothetical protein